MAAEISPFPIGLLVFCLMRKHGDIVADTPENRFNRLVQATCCPFAKTARTALCPTWEPSRGAQQNIVTVVRWLDDFVAHAEQNELDLLVIEIRAVRYTRTLGSFVRLFRRILFEAAKRDPLRTEPLTNGIESLEWDFEYRGTPFFIPVFAPFYPDSHTRWSRDSKSAFILFQPDHSFGRRGINSRSPHRGRVTEQSRRRCVRAGHQYNVDLISGTPKAVRYIHPIDPFGTPVRWWEM